MTGQGLHMKGLNSIVGERSVLHAAIVTVAAIDFVLLYLATNHGITVTRDMPRTCSLGVPLTSELTLENRTSLTLVGSLCDDLPDRFSASPAEHSLRLPPMGRMTAQRTSVRRR